MSVSEFPCSDPAANPVLVCLHLDPAGHGAAAIPAWWRALPAEQVVLALPASVADTVNASAVAADAAAEQSAAEKSVAEKSVAEQFVAKKSVGRNAVTVPAGSGMGAVLAAVHAAFPGHDIAYARADIWLPSDWIARLAEVASADSHIGAVFPLSDFQEMFSPFGGTASRDLAPDLAQRLIEHCATGQVFEVPTFLPICGYFRAAALAAAGNLADAVNPTIRLRGLGWSCVASDCVFAGSLSRDDSIAAAAAAAAVGAEVQAFLANHPLAELRRALAQEMAALDPAAPPVLAAKPVQLHVTHSWGGGVGHWVGDMCAADTAHSNLVLRSLGNASAYAFRLALYPGSEQAMPLREWRLEFPICSIAGTHYHYRKILEEIRRDFQVEGIIVSSLIGHSLDALATGLPTLVVQHDYFPFCPALSIHFGSLCTGCDQTRLRACFAENPLNTLFSDTDVEHWVAIRGRWLELLQAPQVRLVAPSRSVLRNFGELIPAISEIAPAVVPNGSAALSAVPGGAEPGRLQLVVLGSLAPQKGADILREALPGLLELADLHFLGTGRDGASFEGIPGVQVTRSYERAALPALLAAIAPHAGLLLSIVPETFSYTLSELWMMGVPPVATRVGAFAERIEDGRTGWLIEPSAASLLALLRDLDAGRERIATVRNALLRLPRWSREDMVAAYHVLSPIVPTQLQAELLAELPAPRDGRDGRIERLAEMVAERDAWIDHLDEGIARRDGRIDQLSHEVAESSREIVQVEQELRETRAQVVERDARIVALDRAVAEREEQLGAIYRSRSWRVTAPLRWLAGHLKRALRGALSGSKALYLRLPFSAQTVSLHRRMLLDHAPWLLRLAGSRAVFAPVPARREIVGPTAPQAPEWYAANDPRVSIVIVAFNKSEFTIECLRSIWMHTAGVPYEVILVDNGSESFHVEQVRPYLGPAQFLELGANRGFGEGNNIGVEHAAGEFVLLLNNDVTVTPGWLDPVVAVMDAHADAGVVGVRLVYPDGVLQEAGAFLRADGTAWQRGKGESATSAEYNELMVVDYCSAAAVLVRKDVFLRVLGFDLCYDPAYYEDSDLCLKIEQLGLRTYYCPETTVIHHEGATSRDASLDQGLHNVVAVNRQKFIARWEERLRTGPLGATAVTPDPVSAVAGEFGAARKTSATVSPLRVGLYTPYSILPGGGERYLLSIAAALRDIAEVELVASHPWSRLRLLTTARELSLDIGDMRPVTLAEAASHQPYDIFVAMGNEIVPPVAAMGKRNVFHCQFPFPMDRRVLSQRRHWLKGYGSIIVNSGFTRDHVCRQLARHGLDETGAVEVIAPPVELLTDSGEPKQHRILHVGRFFRGGHNKKQLDLVRTFKQMVDQHGCCAGWELHLAGAAHPEFEHREYLLKVVEEARGYPIRVHVNPPLAMLRRLYHTAALYWHATGFDIDENRFPEQHEHFGITTVEAMSAGCVPIVVATAGQREIVRDGVEGFLWRSLAELRDRTVHAVENFDTTEMRMLRANATRRASEFSDKFFADHLRRHLGIN